MENRAIVHLDLDTFFVSCERLVNPQLNNKPVLIGGTSDRGVVASCSYEARKFGIHSAMPMKMARILCPQAVVIRGDSGLYSKFSQMVTDIIKEQSPLYEKSSVDEFYIDISGMDRFFGCFQWATELRQTIIKETRLPLSLGLSINKTVSKVSTGEAKPNGYLQIGSGMEKQFLAPLSIKKIPMVGDKTYQLLRGLGLYHVKTVQGMPVDLMQAAMGVNGISLWKKCQGIDNSPVVPYQERKSISIERTFEQDTIDVQKLNSILIAMAENLAFQLRNGHKLTSCITVKLRYSDFNTYSKQQRLPYTSCDHTLIEIAKDLFQSLYNRRLLVRLIGVHYSHLVEGGHQINMFEDTEETCNLYQAMDQVRNRYGQDAVKKAVAMGSKAIGRFNPFTGEPPMVPAHRRA